MSTTTPQTPPTDPTQAPTTTPTPPTEEVRAALLRERWARGAEFLRDESGTIPTADPRTGHIWGVVHGHRVSVLPALGVYCCDCLDWQHRQHIHGGRCKHVMATEQRVMFDTAQRVADAWQQQ